MGSQCFDPLDPRRATRLAASCAALLAALILCAVPADAASPDQELLDAKRAAIDASGALPFDQPDAAHAYDLQRRAPLDGRWQDLPQRYERALEHTLAMPRWSSRWGREVEVPADPTVPGTWPKVPGTVAKAAELGTWQPLGPGNIGGRTRGLLIHPQRPNTMWAAGISGGVWKTTDGGNRWQPSSSGLFVSNVSILAMDPANPDVLYAGTGEGHFREVVRGTGLPLRGGGIFKSTDGGRGWAVLGATRNGNFHWVNDLAVSPAAPNRVYAATRTGVWRSRDGGSSWQQVLGTGVNGGCFHLTIRPDRANDEMLASCGTFERATVYRNPNAATGGSWQAVLSETGMGLTSLAIAPSDPNVAYALSASYVGGPGGRYEGGLHAVFRSDDGGATWRATVRNSDPVKLNTLLLTNAPIATLQTCGFGSDAYSTLGWYTNVIAVDPADPDVVFAGGVDLFRSDDGGANWGLVTYWFDPASAHADQHVLVFDPRYDGQGNRRLFVGGDGGVYRTDDARAASATGPTATCDSRNSAVRWTKLSGNYRVTQFYHGAAFPGGDRYIAGAQDNGTILGSNGQGIDGWRRVHGGDGGYVAVDPRDNGVVYAESQFFGFVKSVDGGQSFDEASRGVSEGSSSFLFITPFALDPGDPRRLWTGSTRMWRTDDAAFRWSQASSDLGIGKVSALAISPADANRVWAASESGWVARQTQATQAGAGTNWPRSRPRQGFVSSLAAHPSDPEVVYATYAGFGGPHVWRSVDGGASWQSLDGSGATRIPDIPVHSIAVDPLEPDVLYLGTDLGVYVSNDAGETWMAENTGFVAVVTEHLEIQSDGAGTRLFAFTHGQGAWRVDVARTSSTDVAFASAAFTASEGDAAAILQVERTSSAAGRVTVDWSTGAGTAAEGGDFEPASGTLVWEDGETGARAIEVPLLDDDELEDDETFRVVLDRPIGAALANPSVATVTLRDDDPLPTDCVADERTLCLRGGRFWVRATWRDFEDRTGDGRAVDLRTDASALLWFFGPDNWEVLFKLLDGCPINEHFWVYFAAATDVEYAITVVDTVAGTLRRYRNDLGTTAPAVTDIGAFVCP